MIKGGTVTKIEVQQKYKKRVSVFLNGQFAFGLDTAIVSKRGLKKGDTLTEKQIDHLLNLQERNRVKDKAYQLLGRRAHSEHEMRTKLTLRGFNQKVVEKVVTDLRREKLLNDHDFALMYSRSRMIKKSMGPRLLKRELWQKGISHQIVDETLDEIYAEHDQCELAKNLALKNQARYSHLENWQRKKRLGQLLYRRGFEWDLVKEVVDTAIPD